MKMVKSLLLGSAAGLIAVTGAQAADLPVKAKAAEYVKICSLYGVGYYYIPGTDTCIKIGGYVRYEVYHNDTTGNYVDRNVVGRFTRNSNTFAQQARFRLTTDVRTQTEYGTLRSYVSFGLNFLNSADDLAVPAGVGNFAFALERAFIQFAGFTFGRTDTFFGFYNGAAYGLVPIGMDGSSGPLGHNLAAYTWQFGNGLSATISIEDAAHRHKPVTDLNVAFIGGASDAGGQKVPDIVGNIRVDQAWGSAQIMGALHQVSARYYNAPVIGGSLACVGGNAGTTVCDHPGDEWGWAVGGGLTLKMPWDAKDTLSGVIAYGKGATGFVAYGSAPGSFIHKDGLALAGNSDAVFGVIGGVGSGLELTEAWGGTVAFEHYWTPSLRTSAVFGYLDVSYNDNAKAMMLATGACGAAVGTGAVVTASCNPDFSMWRVASRTMWNPVQNLDVGVEVAYTKIDSGNSGLGILTSAQNGLAAGVYNVEDQSYWSAAFRVQRNFWP
jgi:hypothetical protein